MRTNNNLVDFSKASESLVHTVIYTLISLTPIMVDHF